MSFCFLADRAKQIRNHAVINADATDKLVKQLKEENDKLKKLMERGEINGNLVNAASTMSPDSKKAFYYESFIFELIKTNDLLSLCYFHVMLININISF